VQVDDDVRFLPARCTLTAYTVPGQCFQFLIQRQQIFGADLPKTRRPANPRTAFIADRTNCLAWSESTNPAVPVSTTLSVYRRAPTADPEKKHHFAPPPGHRMVTIFWWSPRKTQLMDCCISASVAPRTYSPRPVPRPPSWSPADKPVGTTTNVSFGPTAASRRRAVECTVLKAFSIPYVHFDTRIDTGPSRARAVTEDDEQDN
jgi:hypothetical protein